VIWPVLDVAACCVPNCGKNDVHLNFYFAHEIAKIKSSEKIIKHARERAGSRPRLMGLLGRRRALDGRALNNANKVPQSS
jgi:hypothetical protein